jgi:hypothetical protein
VSKKLWGPKDPKAQAKSLFAKVWKHIRGSKLLPYCIFFHHIHIWISSTSFWKYFLTIFLHSDWSKYKRMKCQKVYFLKIHMMWC